ncbi:MAG TPA: 1-acyl-sn-glycerol-3-phosphate acyltransferase [Leptospiraceae bacterium]|nr:1-acyl-sn-glycerol-3-phosphate acyltransferase [Leptospiraceae bacterium]HNF17154.1 1-acyl-sn-glycerol-3-phosphate acyltransferase [Leptospiraceae bacterium]HNF25353.1 1-acyl-sn-glycerol-3-phosphate acyltransferase [Leptospiraceae bacterium]HNM04682.1 1-acyl-sn-glycerol-3-phosphate acyltransferase [Leptospiraceae bacterium]
MPNLFEAAVKGPDHLFLKALPRMYANRLRDFAMLDVEGVHNIPRSGRVMVVPNHSGVLGWDAIILYNEVFRQRKRLARVMAHAFWESTDFLRKVGQSFGAFAPDFKQAVKYLKKNKLMIIFPEAEHGNFKPTVKMYQLTDFNPGFVALAMMTNTVIVPTVIMGAEENFVNLGTIDIFEKYIGARIPVPMNLLPIPAKWKIKFLPPVDFSKYSRKDAKSEKFLIEVSQNIRFRIQSSIHNELVSRGTFKY